MDIRRGDFDPDWHFALEVATGPLVEVIEDISHHDIGERWNTGDDPQTEVDRLRQRCDELDHAVRTARAGLVRIEARARLASIRRRCLGPAERHRRNPAR